MARLPAGSTIGFETTDMFGADAVDAAPVWGLNNGEWVEIIFILINGADITDLISQLNTRGARVGIHIQRLCLDGEPRAAGVTPIPAPPVFAVCAVGRGMVGFFRRRHGS